VKKEAKQTFVVLEGQCAGPKVCPLSRVQAGTTVCIKELSTEPEIKDRLRELGLGEEQTIKLLACQSNFICLVCNARLGISKNLAEAIMVEALPGTAKTA
jgi:Fe2+ transport system protein FeoA